MSKSWQQISDEANAPDPEGCVSVGDWDAAGSRTFTGSSWRVPVVDDAEYQITYSHEIIVEIRGIQRPDDVARWVSVSWGWADEARALTLPLAATRMLSSALADAHAEAVRMNEADGGVLLPSCTPTFSSAEVVR